VRTVDSIESSASLAETDHDGPRLRDDAITRLRGVRVALVHNWLITLGGADRVLLALHDIFPQAPVFVGLHDLRRLPQTFRQLDLHATWLQRIPGAAQHHRLLVPLMPVTFSRLVLRGYDVVISSSHACAHGVSVPDGLHICYCHTPMRYAWDLQDEYLAAVPAVARPAARVLLAWLRMMDRAAAQRVDHFVANSHHVASRIRRHYGRDAAVIHPPVDTDFFTPLESTPASQSPPSPRSTRSPDLRAVGRGDWGDWADFYLVVSRLVPYKRVDVVVEAFNRLDRPLVVVGDGPERRRLQVIARPQVRFTGEVSETILREIYRRCRALVFAGEEDFGLVPVEAQACGRPVIAYGRGGVLETVVPGVTGVFFAEQTPDALADAVRRADRIAWDRRIIRRHAGQFSHQRFVAQLSEFVAQAVARPRDRARSGHQSSDSRFTIHDAR